MNTDAPLRVLVVDDSPLNRAQLTAGLEASGRVKVIGTASDGGEALRKVNLLAPEAITLDLEMPKIDGFSFLKLLMNSRPTPVIVVSSYSRKENVFRALELGAVDFVAKPDGGLSSREAVQNLLLEKLLLLRNIRGTQKLSLRAPRPEPSRWGVEQTPTSVRPPQKIIAIAASTGGPTALTELMSKLSPRLDAAVLIAQHMPEKFTTTFAERLDRYSGYCVHEASDMEPVYAGHAYVCPGGTCMELQQAPNGSLRLAIRIPNVEDRYVPSADRLFESVAKVMGHRAVGVVLTGMGDDGTRGARALHTEGARILSESEDTAVVYGMPRAVTVAGLSDKIVNLPLMSTAIEGAINSATPVRRL